MTSRSPSASPPDDEGIRRLAFPAPTPPMDDDDLLREILIRLPPLPSELPRASLVSKRWRRLLTDRAFFRRFRARHGKPPLLGFFAGLCRPIFFTPTLDPPDRIPAEGLDRFTSSRQGSGFFCGCRHGLALLLGPERPEAVVWDPATGHRRRVPYPPGFDNVRPDQIVRNAAIFCAAAGDGHAHGADCPFKLVLLRYGGSGIVACVFDSESAVWGDPIWTATAQATNPFAHEIDPVCHSVLVRNALCWKIGRGDVLEFDIGRQSLRVIEMPADAQATGRYFFHHLRTEGGGLGLAMASGHTIQLWERICDPDRWVRGRTIDLSQLGLLGPTKGTLVVPLAFDEDNNAIFIRMAHRIVMIDLGSLQSKMLFYDVTRNINHIYPYTGFVAPGRVADGEDDGLEILNNPLHDWSTSFARRLCPLGSNLL